jgi:predicted dehydrogenase
MKQVFTSKNGVVVKDTIIPSLSAGSILIRVHYSCISAGTEISAVQGASTSLLKRVINHPEQIKQALEIAQKEGVKKLIGKVDSSMEKLGGSGYSISGQVIAVGRNITDIKVGDYVAAGGNTANHSEFVCVPRNLVVKVPDGLELSLASLGTVGSIAMHGVRRADLRLSEFGVVVGCGLMGLLAIQMLKASGVKVACTDVNSARLALAKELGADKVINSADEDPVLAIRNWTNGYGADAVLFTAATHSDEPLSQSFRMCRKKGKVVLLGVSGMNINRGDIYKDEIDFIISTSYGPGRYDSDYEGKGVEYPYAYVRWTENRNIYSFLELVRDGKIDVERIAPKIYPLEDAGKAYDGIQNDPGNHIITIIDYGVDNEKTVDNNPIKLAAAKPVNKSIIKIGLIGAGSFATTVLLPIIAAHPEKYQLTTIVNRSGEKALNAGRQFKAEIISSEQDDVFNDPDIDLVMICTRHYNHAELVLKGLKAGKNVYVEKPLATTLEQLEEIKKYYVDNEGKPMPILMVGFNRRFSKHAREIKRLLDNRTAPVFIRYRMNAGYVPADAWVHGDGGRIIGEGCHLIDLMQFLIASPVADCSVAHFKPKAGLYLSEDNRFITMEFEDGSVAEIEYFSCGSKELPKEYMEVHWENKSVIMDDYKLITGFGVKVKELKSAVSKKGHEEEWIALYEALIKGQSPISVSSLIRTTEISITSSQE